MNDLSVSEELNAEALVGERNVLFCGLRRPYHRAGNGPFLSQSDAKIYQASVISVSVHVEDLKAGRDPAISVQPREAPGVVIFAENSDDVALRAFASSDHADLHVV